MPTSHIQIKRSLSPRIYIIYILNLERNHHQWSTIRDPPRPSYQRPPDFQLKPKAIHQKLQIFIFRPKVLIGYPIFFIGDSSFFYWRP